jgi:hypothetical protein
MTVMQNKRILILATNSGFSGISRLPYALKRAKFEVHAYCPSNSYLAQSDSLDVCQTYFAPLYRRSKLFYITTLFQIIKSGADIVIPGDEESVQILQRLANLCEALPFLRRVHKVIRNSSYPREADTIITHKEIFIKRCRELGVRVPKDIPVRDHDDALEKAKLFSYPVVLKPSSGYGGNGVCICQNETELSKKLQLTQRNCLKQILKKWLKKLFFINFTFDGYEQKFSLQQYISGTVGACPFVALNGELIAANLMLKHRCYPDPTGPASVVKGYKDAEIVSFAKTIVKEINYNGFGSIEFVVNANDKKAYIIELNSRPVPISHFSSEIANDLAVSFRMALDGMQAPLLTFNEFLVALYPSELRRDPDSEFIRDAYHDIPIDEPRLRNALMQPK